MNLSSASKNIELQGYRKVPLERYTRYESFYESNNLNLLYDINQAQKKSFKLFRECSILNFYNTTPRQYKKTAKPVVEVTVTSKYPTTSISKLISKQKYYNKIQTAVSNYENSVQNLNLYPYKRKRRQKLSKVKTSKSDILYYNKHNFKYEDISLDLLNIKRNMPKDDKTSRLKENNKECVCKPKEDYKFEDINAQKNRVTIVGQLGLTQDERYVLKCAATVNDKPIPTSFSQAKSPERPNTKRSFAYDQTTQATQVNFNFSHNNPKKAFKNQIVQCNCSENNVETTMSRTNVLKESKSPLVVISVYPTQDEMGNFDTSPVKIIQYNNGQDKHKIKTQYSNSKDNEKQNKERSHSTNRAVRTRNSRSPSPVNIGRNVSTKRTEGTNNTFAINTRNQSPLRQGFRSKLSSKPDDLKKDMSHTLKQPSDNLKYKKSKSGVEQVKKALVSNFIKNIEKIDKDVSKRKFTASKDDASKVTINIEGDNEDYDVMFERSNFDTGVSVRKTGKVNKKYKNNDETGVFSMENFFMLADDTAVAGPSRQPNKVPKIVTTGSKLNVRDSLEINRRRERGSSNLKSENNELIKKLGKNNSNVAAPIKHFRGDNCSLTDPNDRDREIRELLGVIRDSKKSKISTDVQDKDRNFVRTCSKSIMTGPSIINIFQRKISKSGKNNTKVRNQNKLSREGHYLNTSAIANEPSSLNKTSYYSHDVQNPIIPKNPILNRNIQVLLQLDQFNKSRPIILTRKQYNKVRRTIQCSMSKKLSIEKNCRNCRNHSIISIGEIRARPKHLPLHFDREIQTERTEIKRIAKNKESKSRNKINASKSINDDFIDVDRDSKEKHVKENNKFRKVVSSMEIRYTSVEYMKHSTSSAHVAENDCNTFHHIKQDNSIHTIYKGYRRSVTPNLGTSALSLESCRSFSNNSIRPSDAGDCNIKKPFLRRLISCLVMRSAPDPVFKPTLRRQGDIRTNNSVDSYYINTSLGAMAMSSSLYDTSASFYSNHAAYPINKLKRSFFTSVREFLTSRRIY